MQLVNSSNFDESQRTHGKSSLLFALMLRIAESFVLDKEQNASCWSRESAVSKDENGAWVFQ